MIQSRQEMADFALRQLGAPLIQIEIDDAQLDDCIEMACQWYVERHFDGVERAYYSHALTGTKITVADASIFNTSSDSIRTASDENGHYTGAGIYKINGNVLTTNKMYGYANPLIVGATVYNSGRTASTTITAITLGDIDNGWVPVDDTVAGILKILNITSILGSADYMFNVNYQIMMSEIQNLTSAGTAYFYGVQQFLGHLDFIMKKEKDFRFNRRTNQLFLDIAWSTDVKIGDIVIAEIYRTSDDTSFPKVLNDIWLKKYATALIKKQWGSNVKKYQNMPLPGGVMFNGQQIYNEAIEDIKALEDEAINSSAPLYFMVG